MRFFILPISLILVFCTQLEAQKLQMGMSFYLDYNLYHWYKKPASLSPETESAGQILNLLPIGGMGLWIGRAGSTTLGIEGGIDYSPFSFDTKEYKGMGAVSFPVLVRLTQPFAPQQGISPFFGVGAGLQWNRIDLYGRPSGSQTALNPYFQTRVIEFSLGMGSGWHIDERQTGLIAFYARIGNSPDQAFSMNFGLRAKLLINPNADKVRPIPPRPEDKLYQAHGTKLYRF
jgi:hypothetical protein